MGRQELQAPDGSLPAARGSADVRSDVLAQALRAGALLRAAGRLEDEAWTERLDALAGALLRHVGPDGAVPFALDQDVANTWCAMLSTTRPCCCTRIARTRRGGHATRGLLCSEASAGADQGLGPDLGHRRAARQPHGQAPEVGLEVLHHLAQRLPAPAIASA